jgi:hypothetical protein
MRRELQHTEDTNISRRAVLKGRQSAIRRWQQLWFPFGRKMQLQGMVADNEIICDATARNVEFVSFWSRVFAFKGIDSDGARQFLEAHQPSTENRYDIGTTTIQRRPS